MDPTTVNTVIAILGTCIGAGSAAWLSRKKTAAETQFARAEAATRYNDMASEWIDRLEKKVRSLEEEIAQLKNTIDQYEARIVGLLSQLAKKGE